MVATMIALYALIDTLLGLYTMVVIARVIVEALEKSSLLSSARHQVLQWFVSVLYLLTEPLLGPMRRRLPSPGGIDFSPMILLILIVLLRSWLL